jgi:hypothetical protein
MLLLKAAVKKSSYNPKQFSKVSLPNHKFYFDGIELDESTYRHFHQVVGWEGDMGIVHPCYLHSLAFPLHIMLLLLPEFPFPLLGLVHINNQINQARPIRKGERLTVSSCFGQLELHPKGWMFSIKVEFYSGSELVWQSNSTNLFRTSHAHALDTSVKHSLVTFTHPINVAWNLNTNLGRRYAKVSGDFNPIHLSKLSAKLFGFKQHIIHGMWTKSYCMSSLQKLHPALFMQAFVIDTAFKQPLYLPSQVNMAVQSLGADSSYNEQQFKVVGLGDDHKQQPLHLVGNMRAT